LLRHYGLGKIQTGILIWQQDVKANRRRRWALQVIQNGNSTSPERLFLMLHPTFLQPQAANEITVTVTGVQFDQFDYLYQNPDFCWWDCSLWTVSSISDSRSRYGHNLCFGMLQAVSANATSTVANGGWCWYFTISSSSATVTVTLTNHGYSVGSTFPILIATTLIMSFCMAITL
jgi:hypothetical protein